MATGLGPEDAANQVGLKAYKQVLRRPSFRDRLRVLEAERVPVSDTLSLSDLVRGCKQVLAAALAARQFRNANDALERLEKLYDRYPHLRSDAAPGASTEVAKQEEGAAKPKSRLEKRMAHRSALGAPAPEAEVA